MLNAEKELFKMEYMFSLTDDLKSGNTKYIFFG